MKLSKIRMTLFPRTCAICRRGACCGSVPICGHCRDDYRALLREPCLFCGLPPAECICPHNKQSRFLFWYDSPLSHRLIAMLKYHAKKGRVQFLADRLAALCTERYDAVTFVPRRTSDVRFYGYDHARMLASCVAKRLELPLIETMSCHTEEEQKLLSASQREKSLQGRFRVYFESPEQYPRLLLIDDMSTTGATLRVCSSLLRKAGFQTVSCATLARVPKLYK